MGRISVLKFRNPNPGGGRNREKVSYGMGKKGKLYRPVPGRGLRGLNNGGREGAFSILSLAMPCYDTMEKQAVIIENSFEVDTYPMEHGLVINAMHI